MVYVSIFKIIQVFVTESRTPKEVESELFAARKTTSDMRRT